LSYSRKWITIFRMSAINAPVNLLDLTPVQLKDIVKLLGEPASTAYLILRYIYREYAAGFTEMADLDSSLQQKLAARSGLGELEPLEELVSADAQTRKVLFRLNDFNTIESTIMFFKNPGSGREVPTMPSQWKPAAEASCAPAPMAWPSLVQSTKSGMPEVKAATISLAS